MVTSCLAVLALSQWIQWWFELPPWPIPATVLALTAIVYVWKKGVPLTRVIRNLKLGRDGERVVAEFLEPLRAKGYRVFHDVSGNGFNIDHVIIGPAGVFAIETKTRNKPMRGTPVIVYDGNTLRLEDGQTFDEPLNQARAQSRWLASLLNDGRRETFTIRPVVVFPEWYVEQIGPRSKNDVWVLNPKALDKFLDHEPPILSPPLIDSAANTLTRHCRLSIG
jgi:hypothetical protein